MTSASLPGVAALLNDIRGIRQPQVGAFSPAATVRVPTLVLHGADDHFVPLPHGAFYASSIPGAVAEWYPGGAHLFLQTFGAEVTSRIRSFLAMIGN